MGWLASVGEFCGSFGASFIERRARIKQRGFGSTKADGDIAAYNAVNEGLKDCLPMDAIDANPGLRKREICVHLLKYAVIYLCSEDPADLVRAATYTMIACK